MMISHEKNGLKYYQFESFIQTGVTHGAFTRFGGVSPAPFSSLNMSTTRGDSRENVLENLRRMFEVLDLDLDSRYDGWQTHTTASIYTQVTRGENHNALQADGLMTDRNGITLVQRFGDCVPVILYDPVHRAVAIYHAGWQGTVGKIGTRMIERMGLFFGTKAADVLAGIGPSIGPDHFFVRQDVVDQFERAYGSDLDQLLMKDGELMRIDLWKANRLTLQDCGVNQIETAEICTVCNRHEWFSHRGDAGDTGRFGFLITLD